jgi:hypothetical protein
LEYGQLKRWVESAGRVAKAPRRARTAAPPTLVELMTSQAVGLSECLLELEGRRGKLRIQWKGTSAPDLSGRRRALWESK